MQRFPLEPVYYSALRCLLSPPGVLLGHSLARLQGSPITSEKYYWPPELPPVWLLSLEAPLPPSFLLLSCCCLSFHPDPSFRWPWPVLQEQLAISHFSHPAPCSTCRKCLHQPILPWQTTRSEEHTSELLSLMRITYAVLCLKTK